MESIIQKLKEISPAKLALLGFKKIDDTPKSEQQSIAIVGMSGRFPGQADTLEKFWDNLKSGVDCITELPDNRVKEYRSFQDKIYCSHAGYLDKIDQFD